MSQLIDADYLGISKIAINKVDDKVIGYAISFDWGYTFEEDYEGTQVKREPHKPWLARIDGTDPKWGYKRNFKAATKEIKDVKQKQGLKAVRWLFEPGYLYEYKNFMADYLTDYLVHGFFAVFEDGIMPLETEEVRIFLNMPVKDRNKYGQPKSIKKSGKYADDNIPF